MPLAGRSLLIPVPDDISEFCLPVPMRLCFVFICLFVGQLSVSRGTEEVVDDFSEIFGKG